MRSILHRSAVVEMQSNSRGAWGGDPPSKSTGRSLVRIIYEVLLLRSNTEY